ncbi:MAG: response regulator [Myxococcales bacterium]|nr:response regulator [Myxococcales bacterium]
MSGFMQGCRRRLSLVFERIDGFLSLSERDLDIESRRRVRLLNWGGVVLAMLLLFWLVNQIAYAAWPLAAWQAGLLLATIGVMVAVRRATRFSVWAHLMCLAMVGAAFSATAYSGGLTMASLSLLLAVPVCAVVLAGIGGLWWTLVVVGGVSWMGCAEAHGVVFPFLTPEDWRLFDTVMTWLTSFVGITLMFSYNHAICARAERDQEAALAEARGVSESKTRFLSSLNREIREPLHHILGIMVLLKDEPSTERRRELGREARGIGQALVAGVEAILRLARDEHLLEVQRERLAGEPRLEGVAVIQGEVGSQPPARRVLVAEDDPVGRRMLARILTDLGCEVVETSDGRAALQALRDGGFDLALVDCGLPEMDGLTLTRELRRFEAEARGERTGVFGMSAERGMQQEAACREAGMDGFLPKPFGRREIEALLNRARRGPIPG